MPFAALQFPLYRNPNELGAIFAVLKHGVDAVKRSLREACRGLLVVDLLPTHAPKIDDITNCYKLYFSRYHLLQPSTLMISSNHQNGDAAMTAFAPSTLVRSRFVGIAGTYTVISCDGIVTTVRDDAGNAIELLRSELRAA